MFENIVIFPFNLCYVPVNMLLYIFCPQKSMFNIELLYCHESKKNKINRKKIEGFVILETSQISSERNLLRNTSVKVSTRLFGLGEKDFLLSRNMVSSISKFINFKYWLTILTIHSYIFRCSSSSLKLGMNSKISNDFQFKIKVEFNGNKISF